MSTTRKTQLKRLVLYEQKRYEAMQKDLQQRMPGIPVSVGPGWPHIEVGPNAAKISRILSTPEKSRRQIMRRLKRFKYPYSTLLSGEQSFATRGEQSFYTHVKTLGHLNYLLEPPFLGEIRQAWFARLDYELEKQQKAARKSQHDYPLEFHRKMMQEALSSAGRATALVKKYHVPKRWIAEYICGIQRQLLNEAAICYPEMLKGFISNSRIYPRAHTVDTQMSLFNNLHIEFKRQGQSNKNLAYQLTALLCSADSCFTTGVLEPNPEAVRRNMKDRRRQPPKK